jgi:hypothetical protein
MFTEKTISVDENETTRTCINCKELLPMDSFKKNKGCVGGHERTCRKCRAGKKKLSEAFKKSEARREKDGMTTNVRAVTVPIVEPLSLPVPDITDDDMSIDVDFTRYPELMTSVIDVASREFRTPQMQILYMLSKFSDKC